MERSYHTYLGDECGHDFGSLLNDFRTSVGNPLASWASVSVFLGFESFPARNLPANAIVVSAPEIV